MSSPCTGPRLVRCRVRDLASCFYACRLPLEEDQPETCRKSPEMSSGSIVFDFEGNGRGQKATRKMSINAKKMGGESSVESSSSSSYNINNRNISGGEAERRFGEEEYIVFCFREDGAIDMINNEGKSSEENDEHNNITTAAAAATTLWKGDEKGSKKTETERHGPDDEIKEMMKPVSVEQQNSSNMDSYESCDSNLSDTSTSSFAFPVLGIEWIGSPVHMPRSGKHNDQSVCLHCCRF